MNIKKFREGYRLLLVEKTSILEATWEVFGLMIFLITVIILIPFIPFIMLGKFIYDKIKERRNR